MKLRRLDVKDLYSLLKIWKEYKGKKFNEGLSTDVLVGGLSMSRVHIWAIEEKKYFSAFIIFSPARDVNGEEEIFIDDVYVKPTKQKRGLGKMLVGCAVDEAKRQGFKKVSFKCGIDMSEFASKIGFKDSYKILSKEV
jgi:GNAT superfamily N-acetyltransferase